MTIARPSNLATAALALMIQSPSAMAAAPVASDVEKVALQVIFTRIDCADRTDCRPVKTFHEGKLEIEVRPYDGGPGCQSKFGAVEKPGPEIEGARYSASFMLIKFDCPLQPVRWQITSTLLKNGKPVASAYQKSKDVSSFEPLVHSFNVGEQELLSTLLQPASEDLPPR